jgi:hypothetical protein
LRASLTLASAPGGLAPSSPASARWRERLRAWHEGIMAGAQLLGVAQSPATRTPTADERTRWLATVQTESGQVKIRRWRQALMPFHIPPAQQNGPPSHREREAGPKSFEAICCGYSSFSVRSYSGRLPQPLGARSRWRWWAWPEPGKETAEAQLLPRGVQAARPLQQCIIPNRTESPMLQPARWRRSRDSSTVG